MEIHRLVQHLRAGDSDRHIQRALGVHRNTVKKYRLWAQAQGLLEGPMLSPAQIHTRLDTTLEQTAPAQNVSLVAPFAPQVHQWRKAGVEMAAIYQRLQAQGYTGSYSSVYRFVRQQEPVAPDVPVRIETAPGQEAQVDFGYAGRLLDPLTDQLRKSWAFVMTLSWSRHQYVELVFDQQIATWIYLHRQAFAFLGGVPHRVVVDNLKAAVLRAHATEPQLHPAYAECAAHYGFLVAPCRPRTPQHKGKVEKGGVHYVKRNFLAGRAPTSLAQANKDVLRWCEQVAGQRVHGTTQEKPGSRFQQTEKAVLQPLPTSPYELAAWKQAKVHRDGYVVFNRAYYSVPFRLVHQPVYLRDTGQQLRIYTSDHQLVTTHPRAHQPGQRQTHPDHIPDHKRAGVLWQRPECRHLAQQIGPATQHVVEGWLTDPVLERLPTARRLLRLESQVGADRLEAACARAVRFDDPAYSTIRRILTQGLENQGDPTPDAAPPAHRFVRTAEELLGHLRGGLTWT